MSGWTVVYRRARLSDTIVAAVAVLLASLSLAPLFQDASWLVTAAVAILTVAIAGAAARALALPLPLVPVTEAVALLVALMAVFVGDRAWAGIVPTPAAFDALSTLLGRGMVDVLVVLAPAPVDPGLVLLAAGGVGLAALSTDTLFVSVRAPVLAGLPLLAVFLAGPVLPRMEFTWWAFAAPAVGWLLILAADQRERVREWTGLPAGTRVRGLSTPARRIGLVAVAVATLIGIALPVASSAGTSGTGSGEGDLEGVGAQAVLLDPLVSMRRSLTQADDVEVLRYRTDARTPSYLRVSVLESFDGSTWRPREGLEAGRVTGDPLPGPIRGGTDAPGADAYDISVSRLANSYLPMPYPAQSVEDVSGLAADWRVDPATGMAFSADQPASGLAYRVVTDPTRIDPAQLRAAGPPTGEFWPLLNLPNSLSPTITQLAQDVTAGERTPYDRALALQRWFTKDGGFAYSTSVRSGAGADYIAEFLQDRIGYCEQFAGAMAVMARSLGIPSRVVVGFTQGSPTQDGTWRVTARDAHAWPELWFDGVGWVRFEPTPRADATVQAPAYAPVAPEDVVDGRQQALLDLGGQGSGTLAEQPAGPARWLLPGVALLALIGLGFLSVPMVRRQWHRRRRLGFGVRNSDQSRIAEGAWDELGALAIDLGQPWSSTSTPRQAADRLTRGMPEAPAQALQRLRAEVERSRYGRPVARPATRERAEAVRGDLAVVTAELRRRVRWQSRLAAYCWPSSERRRQRSSILSMKPEDGLGAAGPVAGAAVSSVGRAPNAE